MEDADEIRIPDILQFVADASRTVRRSTSGPTRSRRPLHAVRDRRGDPHAAKGGRSPTAGRIVPRITPLRERLLKEVWKSVDLAAVSPIVNGDLTVHIDANPVVKHKSSAYVQELVGLVVGQGFKALIKPRSWAASCWRTTSCAAAGSCRRTFRRSIPRSQRCLRAGLVLAITFKRPCGRARADIPGRRRASPHLGDRRRPFRARVLTKEVSEPEMNAAGAAPESSGSERRAGSTPVIPTNG